MIIKCRECGKEISSKSKRCPHFGIKTKSLDNRMARFIVIVFGVIFGTMMLFTVISSKPDSNLHIKSASSESNTEKQPYIYQQKETVHVGYMSYHVASVM